MPEYGAGDTNLDGIVDQNDYVNIIANMGSTNSQWFLGDLNHDGNVTVDDLAEVNANLTLGPSFAAGPVLPPEPATSAKRAAHAAAPKPAAKKPVAKKPLAKRPTPTPLPKPARHPIRKPPGPAHLP